MGIAIGSGSDIAISSAKFVLVSSNLYSLLTLIELSRTVFRRVMFKFAWALVYNIAFVTDRSWSDLSSIWTSEAEPGLGELSNDTELFERRLIEFGHEDASSRNWVQRFWASNVMMSFCAGEHGRGREEARIAE